MDWNEIQNFSSNVVFGILLFAMVVYWINLSFFNEKSFFFQIGRISIIISNVLLFFIHTSLMFLSRRITKRIKEFYYGIIFITT